MTSTAGEGSMPVEPAPDVLALAVRLAGVIGHCRPEARFNLETFLAAVEAEMGGTLVIESPSKRAKKSITEVRYASSGLALNSGIQRIGMDD